MVNASLNWASIVGIVLAVCGAGLYFLRSFKPALARDYDVFFAAIGLLCGGILFFQGWRLDPILQFGQFLLAATTVFFAYESVRLRGIATDQARRSSYFDDEPAPTRMPGGGNFRDGWDDNYDQFDESPPLRRRFASRDEQRSSSIDDDFYSPRRTSRAAIPEQAASRNLNSINRTQGQSWKDDSEQARRMGRFQSRDEDSISPNRPSSSFGERRNIRQGQKRGSRPVSSRENSQDMRPIRNKSSDIPSRTYSNSKRPGSSQAPPLTRNRNPEDAAYSPSKLRQEGSMNRRPEDRRTDRRIDNRSSNPPASNKRRRDNSSRFDD